MNVDRMLTVGAEARDVGLDLDSILRLGEHHRAARLVPGCRLHDRHHPGNALPLRAVLMMRTGSAQVQNPGAGRSDTGEGQEEKGKAAAREGLHGQAP